MRKNFKFEKSSKLVKMKKRKDQHNGTCERKEKKSHSNKDLKENNLSTC